MTEEKVETERVTQLWPKALKDEVRVKAGDRGLTEFTIEAVQIHLGVTQDYEATVKELNEVKYFAQQMADQIVLGVNSPEERLQTLMELEFPAWIDTSGWPESFAARVRPAPFTDPGESEGLADLDAGRILDAVDAAVEIVGDKTVMTEEDAEKVAVVDDLFKPKVGKRDDLFAKVMAKTGGKLTDVPGLKLASDIEKPEKPEPAPVPERPSIEDIEVEF